MLPLSLALAAPRGAPARRLSVQSRPKCRRSARRGARPPQLCAAGARLFHLRLPAVLHHRPPAGLSGRSRAAGLDRRLDHRRDRPVQHLRLGRVGLARQPDAQALHAVGDLLQPLARDPGLHPAAAEPGGDADLRRGDRPALAVDHSADLGAGRDHVRSALADHAARHRLFSAIRSAASSASGSAACCSSAPAPTTWSGGARSSSALPRPSSICRSSRSRCRVRCWRQARVRSSRCSQHVGHELRKHQGALPDSLASASAIATNPVGSSRTTVTAAHAARTTERRRGEVQGDRDREGRQGQTVSLTEFDEARSHGRRRHRPGRMVDHQLQGRARDHRQGAGGAAVPDDPRHRFRGQVESLQPSGLEAWRQGHPQRLGSGRNPSRRLCRKGARQRPMAGAAAGRA